MKSYAIAHDFLVAEGGAEQCAIEFAGLLPSADVYTSFFDDDRFGTRIHRDRVHPWPLQRVFGPTDRFRIFLPFYAAYFSSLRIDADLVLSSSIAFTKAVRTPADSEHVAYVYTPMRYAWDLDTYLAGSSYGGPTRLASRLIRPLMQRWDRATSGRPDRVIAISETVRQRIERLWRRDVEDVIYPPVPLADFKVSARDEGYLLVAARLLAYRRIDLAVVAATRLGRELVVIGDGPERRRLEALAGPSVRFLGHMPRPELIRHIEACHAYVLPGVEDFGIAPVEAMAAGKPVIAFRGGGATETVVEGLSGVFFDDQSAHGLADAISAAERMTFDPHQVRAQAARFDRATFLRRWRKLLGLADETVPKCS